MSNDISSASSTYLDNLRWQDNQNKKGLPTYYEQTPAINVADRISWMCLRPLARVGGIEPLGWYDMFSLVLEVTKSASSGGLLHLFTN